MTHSSFRTIFIVFLWTGRYPYYNSFASSPSYNFSCDTEAFQHHLGVLDKYISFALGRWLSYARTSELVDQFVFLSDFHFNYFQHRSALVCI